MPELPEVETVRRSLSGLILGKKVCHITSSVYQLRYPLPDKMQSILAGKSFQFIQRKGKYLCMGFDSEDVLLCHLGMSGAFFVLPEGAASVPHEHVRFSLDDGSSLRYRDPRRFGYMGLTTQSGLAHHPWLKRVGIEPLSQEFDANVLYQLTRGRSMPIKSFLMQSHVVAGIGNIYACESLFLAGIKPSSPAGKVSRKRVEKLVHAIQAILNAAIAAGGSSIRDFVQADGKPGYFSFAFKVYNRAGKACLTCGASINKIVMSGRSTFYCSTCQH